MRHSVVVVLLAALATSAGAQWLEAQFGIPDTMPYIAGANHVLFRQDNHHAYVAGLDLDYLQILDYTTHSKVKRIETQGNTTGIIYCLGRDRLYVLADGLFVLDGNDSLLGEVSLNGYPLVGFCNPLTHRVYIGTDYDGVYVLDPGPDTLRAVLDIRDNLTRAVFDSAGNQAFFLGDDGSDSSLYVIACGPDTLRARLDTPYGHCTGIEFDPLARQVYVLGTDIDQAVVWAYDADSLNVTAIVELPESWEDIEGGLLLNPASGFLYAYWAFWFDRQPRDYMEDSIAVINTADMTLHGFIELPEASDLNGLHLNPQDNKVYATFWQYESVAVIRSPDTIAAWVDLGSASYVAAWCPATNEVLVPDDNDLLSFISGASDSIVAQMDYRGLYVDALTWVPAGNKLYASGSSGIAVIGPTNEIRKTIWGYTSSEARPAYSPELNRLYLTQAYRNKVRVFDCNTDTFATVESVPMEVSYYDSPYAVPDQHKVYIPSTTTGVAVYDTYLDSVVKLRDDFGAGYCFNPRTGLVYGSLWTTVLTIIDPVADSVIDTIEACPVTNIELNTTDNEIYSTDAPFESHWVYVIDLDSRLLTDSIDVPGHPHCLAWYEPLNKLYAVTDTWIVAIDCRSRSIVKSIRITPAYSLPHAVFSYRNDRLWVGNLHGIWVVQCRIDSLVSYFPQAQTYTANMAWNSIDNRVYTTNGRVISIFRDNLIGIEEEDPLGTAGTFRLQANPTAGLARFALPPRTKGTLAIRDVAGRLVWQTRIAPGHAELNWPGIDLNGTRVPAGIYFAELESAKANPTLKVVLR